MKPVVHAVRLLWLAVVPTVALMLALPGSASARGLLPEHPGYGSYQQYCASCHGLEAVGDGPMAPVLNVPPANLRLLSIAYGSPLPRPKLIAFIDGRKRVSGHGSREMPVWGRQLGPGMAGDPGREATVRGMILVLIDYLDAIQLQPPSATEAP